MTSKGSLIKPQHLTSTRKESSFWKKLCKAKFSGSKIMKIYSKRKSRFRSSRSKMLSKCQIKIWLKSSQRLNLRKTKSPQSFRSMIRKTLVKREFANVQCCKRRISHLLKRSFSQAKRLILFLTNWNQKVIRPGSPLIQNWRSIKRWRS